MTFDGFRLSKPFTIFVFETPLLADLTAWT